MLPACLGSLLHSPCPLARVVVMRQCSNSFSRHLQFVGDESSTGRHASCASASASCAPIAWASLVVPHCLCVLRANASGGVTAALGIFALEGGSLFYNLYCVDSHLRSIPLTSRMYSYLPEPAVISAYGHPYLGCFTVSNVVSAVFLALTVKHAASAGRSTSCGGGGHVRTHAAAWTAVLTGGWTGKGCGTEDRFPGVPMWQAGAKEADWG